MSNINAAIGLVQIGKLEEFINKKREIVRLYNESFGQIRDLKLINWDLDQTAPFTYILRVLGGRRDELMEYLKSKGVGSGVHYIPNHIQPFFKRYSRHLPQTEKVSEEILTLPLYYDMAEADIDKVIVSVKSFFSADGSSKE